MILNVLFMVNFRVLRISSKSCYVGDEASLWFSTLLNKPGCKMYQIHEPRDSTKDTKWGNLASPGDKVGSEIVHFCSGLSNCEIQVSTWFLDTSVERVCGKQATWKISGRLLYYWFKWSIPCETQEMVSTKWQLSWLMVKILTINFLPFKRKQNCGIIFFNCWLKFFNFYT